MSSFKRRVPSTTLPPPPGTHPSPSLSSLNLLPTGLPSLDDLLGGGLPLGSILLVLAPDMQSAWNRLVERYWIAQALVSGQQSVVVGDEDLGSDLVEGCMWTDRLSASAGEGAGDESQSEGEMDGDQNSDAKKIAWRYEKMARFKTTVGGSGSNLSLLHTIPPAIIKSIHETKQQTYIPLDPTVSVAGPSSSSSSRASRFDTALAGIYEKVSQADEKRATRITVHELGSLDWGDDVSEAQIHRFIHSLRSIIRTKSTSALITVPPHLIAGSGPEKEAFINRLAWGVDACIELKGFADDPTLPPQFPTTHGLLTLHQYPTSHVLLPSTLKHSTLLGVSQNDGGAGGGGGGAGENNLGFRLKRKRFVVETVHLGVEGGVGERQVGGDVGGALAGASASSSTSGPSHGIVPAQSPSTYSSTNANANANATSSAISSAGPTSNPDTSSGVDEGAHSLPVDQGVDRPRGPQGEVQKKSKPRARVRFGGEEEMVVQVGSGSGPGPGLGTHEHQHGEEHDHSHSHSHAHSHGKSAQTPRVGIRHDRPDLYEF